MHLKKLNTALFPVRYNDKYYADALASGEFTKLAYYSDICVGSIACRLEKKEGGAIPPYRGLGSGEYKAIEPCSYLCSKQNISEIYLHVQQTTKMPINFYKKFGFEITETIKKYYTNIDPPRLLCLTKLTATSQAKK
ncbi:hypothetical protein V6Z11_1Z075100 [Gossypium hirsutum]